jgi:hypothetical protein
MTRGRRSRQVTWNAGMASGFCGVTGARPVQLRSEARAHEGVARLIRDLHPRRLPDPLAPRLRRREAVRTREGLLEAGQHAWREGDRCARRHVGGPSCAQAPGGIDRQPAADGMAVHPQSGGHVLAGVGLPTGQQGEHLQAELLMAVMCTWQAVFQLIRPLRHPRYGCPPELSSRPASSLP